MGLTYIDPVGADPVNPGEALTPAINWASRQTYVDAQTSVPFQPVTLPHDITGIGNAYSAYSLAASFVTPGSAWSGSTFPFTGTGSATSPLIFRAAGMQFWPPFPMNSDAASYSSDIGGSLNWVKWVVVAKSSNAGCPGLGARCTIQMRMSENGGVSADPWSPTITCALNSTNTTCTFGTGTTANQGGWNSSTHRWRNGPELVDRNQGNAVCNGTANVTIGQPTNPLWTNGTPLTINGTAYTINAVTGESSFTLNSTCPSGTYLYNISSLCWMITVQAASSDTITIVSATSQYEIGAMPAWPDAAFWPQSSWSQLPGASSAPSYLLATPDQNAIYSINASTGATALIGPNLVNNNVCGPNSAAFDTRPNQAINYCVSGGNQLFARTYNGSFVDLGNLDSNNQLVCGSSPCWTQVNLTSGSSLDALALAFDPAYLGSTKGISCNQLVGINQSNHLVIRCWSNDTTFGYIGVFDPLATSNSQAGNAGCMVNVTSMAPGCFIAFTSTFQTNSATRGDVMKGSVEMNIGPGILEWQPVVNGIAGENGSGPLQVNMTGTLSATPGACPTNPYVTGNNCSTITVSGEPYKAHPGPNETGAPGEYITAQAGDILGVNMYTILNNPPGTPEAVRIVVKNSPTSWVVQRGFTEAFAYCTPPLAANSCGYGGPAVASSANPILYYAPANGEVFWQYLTDPTGANIQVYNYTSSAHRMTQNGQDIDCCNVINTVALGQPTNWTPCVYSTYTLGGCYGTRIAPNTPALLTTLASGLAFTGSTPLYPQFNSVPAVVGNNQVQFHAALPGQAGSADSLRYFEDARPYNGQYGVGGQPCNATNVTGSLWKIASGCYASGPNALNRKTYPTKAQWGWHPLSDVSGPSSAVSTTANWTYCVVLIAGECRTGSAVGEIYFSVPYLSYQYCLTPGQAGSNADVSDICILDNNAMLDTVLELPIDDPSDRGLRQRILGHMFAPGLVNSPFGNLSALPNNAWWLAHTRMFGTVRSEILLLSRPPEVVDTINRTQYTTQAITLPPGPGYTILQWGYPEYGANGSTNWACTSRNDSCNSTNSPTSTTPFLFGAETQSPTVCNMGCSIQMNLIPDRLAYYRWVRTSATGVPIAYGPTQVVLTQ